MVRVRTSRRGSVRSHGTVMVKSINLCQFSNFPFNSGRNVLGAHGEGNCPADECPGNMSERELSTGGISFTRNNMVHDHCRLQSSLQMYAYKIVASGDREVAGSTPSRPFHYYVTTDAEQVVHIHVMCRCVIVQILQIFISPYNGRQKRKV